jgi:large subunit ribosomal protein L9
VGEQSALYGSVTTADIAEALAARNIEVDRRKIQLVDPLKTLGEHTVPVKVHREVTAQLKVVIVAA